MAIKFGMITNPALDILEEIKHIARLNFDYVEVGIEIPGGAPEILIKNRSKILNLFTRFDSPAIAHTAWWIDFGTGYEAVRKSWVAEAKNSVAIAEKLGIKKINFHFHSIGLRTPYYKKYHKEILANMAKSLREVMNYASSKKITVFLENSPIKKSTAGIKEFKFIIDNVPKLKAHLDVGHAFVEDGMKGVKDYLFTFKDKLEHMHISDNNGEWDEHLPLGEGQMNFEKVAKWLKQINYDKTITFEVFTSKEDARDSMSWFRKLL